MSSLDLFRHSFTRTRIRGLFSFWMIALSIGIIWIAPPVESSKLASRHRKSTPDDNSQTFECTNANTYLYNVLSQSKSARSLNSDTSTADGSSNRHHPAIPQKAINGDHLKVCAQGFTCCTEEVETRLLGESKREFQKSVQDKIVGLSHTFESRTKKFDRFFRDLLSNARRDLHNMFLRTYGLLYEQNSDIFAALFDNLTNYYGNGPGASSAVTGHLQTSSAGMNKVNLSRAIDSFYNTLYQRMFRILNQPYDFEPRYWQCMSGQMERLKPFGDVPANMKQQVQRAFVAARTFVQGLAVGRDVVRKMMEVSPSNECTSSLTRMLYCPHCGGLSNVKPCSNFCLNVMKGCLAYQSDFDSIWNEYLDALLQLLNRLEGPFNIESVIDPIDVKISEAIMSFQDRGKEISDQIFSECGSPRAGPTAGRQRRGRHSGQRDEGRAAAAAAAASAPSGRRQGQRGRTGGRNRQRQNKQRQRNFGDALAAGSPRPFPGQPASVRPTTAAGTSLDRLARDLREKVQPAKGFWRQLPHTLCTGEKVATAGTDGTEKSNVDCWNGRAKDRYESPVASDEPFGRLINPEVSLDPSRAVNPIVNDLLSKLRAAISAMKRATNGHEPNWRQLPTISDTTPRNVQEKSNSSSGPENPTKSAQSKRAELIETQGDSSGDIFDDTEPIGKSNQAVKGPEISDDEEFFDGSGSGDGEMELPPFHVLPVSKTTSTRKPTKQVFSGKDVQAGVIEVDKEDTTQKSRTSTTASWASSEENSNGNTFEPITSMPAGAGDDESEEDEDYDEHWDEDEKDWKEDEYGVSTSAPPSTTTPVGEIRPAPPTSLGISTTEGPATTTTSPATIPPVRKQFTAATRKPTTPKAASAATTSRYELCNLYFLLAFYLALSLLWKRLL